MNNNETLWPVLVS